MVLVKARPPTMKTVLLYCFNFSTSEMKSRSEEHTSELQSPCNLVCRLLLEKKKEEIRYHRFQLSLTHLVVLLLRIAPLSSRGCRLSQRRLSRSDLVRVSTRPVARRRVLRPD